MIMVLNANAYALLKREATDSLCHFASASQTLEKRRAARGPARSRSSRFKDADNMEPLSANKTNHE